MMIDFISFYWISYRSLFFNISSVFICLVFDGFVSCDYLLLEFGLAGGCVGISDRNCRNGNCDIINII